MPSASPFSILPDNPERAHLHPHESFSAARELEARLKATVRGEVRFDEASRALYATDASNYRQVPIGLVLPQDTEDVIATIAACREFGAPVLSRGGGTSLAGQCCNIAVVIDFSRYMNSILDLDPAARLARCLLYTSAITTPAACTPAPRTSPSSRIAVSISSRIFGSS